MSTYVEEHMKQGYTVEQLKEVIKQSVNISDSLRKLNLKPCGANYQRFNYLVRENKIDISHFLGQASGPKTKHETRGLLPLDAVLIEHSNYNRRALRKRLFKNKLLENKCYECGITDIWNNKPITLHLDHVNGINDDNRIENLRILCPNCHSQTSTYAGKNKKSHYSNKCFQCSLPIQSDRKWCKPCFKEQQYKQKEI